MKLETCDTYISLLPMHDRLSTMEISNEKLASLNTISEQNFAAMFQEFRQHTQTLVAMKRQLDSCFRRIRSLKSKLATQYPEAYQGKLLTSAKFNRAPNITHCSCCCQVSA